MSENIKKIEERFEKLSNYVNEIILKKHDFSDYYKTMRKIIALKHDYYNKYREHEMQPWYRDEDDQIVEIEMPKFKYRDIEELEIKVEKCKRAYYDNTSRVEIISNNKIVWSNGYGRETQTEIEIFEDRIKVTREHYKYKKEEYEFVFRKNLTKLDRVCFKSINEIEITKEGVYDALEIEFKGNESVEITKHIECCDYEVFNIKYANEYPEYEYEYY